MQLLPIKTHKITIGESLLDILDSYIPPLTEHSIVAVTSKIVSVCEKAVVAKETLVDKTSLIRQEADLYLDSEDSPIQLTIKNGILIPSSGIDESNGNGFYILYPRNISASATQIWKHLRGKHKVHNLGIIITDSHTTPMRRGVTGIGIGWCGFNPIRNYIGTEDLFERPLRVTTVNLLDALAASCVFVMGEGAESTPLAVMREVDTVEYLDTPPDDKALEMIKININEDLYAPLLKNPKWTNLK